MAFASRASAWQDPCALADVSMLCACIVLCPCTACTGNTSLCPFLATNRTFTSKQAHSILGWGVIGGRTPGTALHGKVRTPATGARNGSPAASSGRPAQNPLNTIAAAATRPSRFMQGAARGGPAPAPAQQAAPDGTPVGHGSSPQTSSHTAPRSGEQAFHEHSGSHDCACCCAICCLTMHRLIQALLLHCLCPRHHGLSIMPQLLLGLA